MAYDFNMPKDISKEDLKEFNDLAAKSGFKPVAGDIGHYMLGETQNRYKSRDEAMDVNDKYAKDHKEIPMFEPKKEKNDLQDFLNKFFTMPVDNIYVAPANISTSTTKAN